MELFSNDTKPYAFYVSVDGNYGDASDIVVIDLDEVIQDHFIEMIEGVHDWQRPKFVRWNLTFPHEPLESDYSVCSICENYDPDNFHYSPEEILNDLESDEE